LITHNIKWFLGLSVAVHATALVSWPPSENKIGHSGQPLLLAVTNHSGEAVQPPQLPAPPHPQPITDQTLAQQPASPPPVAAATAAQQQPDKHLAARQRIDPPAAVRSPAQNNTPRPAQTTRHASSPTHEQQEQHLRSSVMDLITRKLTYPAIARRKGWQGVVRLELHIEPDGLISGLHIDATSGYTVLDEAALQSLQLANIPDAARWLHGNAVNIVVPVEFRLIDG
jgi:periplasmic protein TonB